MAAVLPANGVGGGGLLGRFAERRPRIAAYLKDRPQALMQFGLGLLSGEDRAGGWANAAQGLAYGQQADQANRDRRTQESERAAREEARNNLFMTPEFQSLSAQEKAWFLANPDAADQFITGQIQHRLAPPAAPEPTDDIREYEYAKSQGFAGSFQEWQMQRPPSTQITNNVGPTGIQYPTPPFGMDYQRDAQGTIVLDANDQPTIIRVPGGDQAVAAAAAAARTDAAGQRTDTTGGIVLEDIDRALDGAGAWTTGLLSRLTVGVPGTPAYDLARIVDTIKANIGFDQLQAMRAASPTGGALGAVSDSENRMLQSVLGNLETSQSATQFRENLQRLKTVYLDLVHGAGNWTIGADGQVTIGPPAAAAGGAAAPVGGYPENTIIENDAGQRMILRGGQWVPM